MTDEPNPDRRNDLVEPGGVDAGSSAGERDREPDGDIVVRPSAGVPVRDAPAPDEIVGAPGQTDDTPGQQLSAGEG